MNTPDESFETLVEAYHTPGDHGVAEPVLGSEAAEEGQRLLMIVTQTQTVEQAVKVALGRPRLDASGIGPMWKVRTTHALDAKVRLLATHSGNSRSEIIRKAVAAYSP